MFEKYIFVSEYSKQSRKNDFHDVRENVLLKNITKMTKSFATILVKPTTPKKKFSRKYA